MIDPIRNLLFHFVVRLAIPLWLAVGAGYKLAELNPKLLPAVVFKAVQVVGRLPLLESTAWIDGSIRAIVLVEFILVAVMLCMPRLSRMVAIATMGLFCAILLSVIVPEYQRGGLDAALKGSCGCFGASGPNPVVMLAIDGTLLILALLARRSPRLTPLPRSFGLGSAGLLSTIALGAILATPARETIDPASGAGDQSAPAQVSPPPVQNGAVVPQPQAQAPPVQPAGAPGTLPWPGLPAAAAPYYVPEFQEWLGKRIDSQELARLITPPPPADFGSGTWFVLFYREDCEHCHDLMQRHFTGALATPTIAIAIPDTDPAASLEMPCTQCQVRTLVKGPEYVLTTPVLLRLEQGVVTRLALDPDDHAAIEQVIAP